MGTKSRQAVGDSNVTGTIYQSSVSDDAVQRVRGVAAGAITQVVASKASPEVQQMLTDLMHAIEALAPHLEPGQSDQVARDAETIATEVASESPSKAILQAVGERLAATARTVGEVGLPVVDFVAKLVALF